MIKLKPIITEINPTATARRLADKINISMDRIDDEISYKDFISSVVTIFKTKYKKYDDDEFIKELRIQIKRLNVK